MEDAQAGSNGATRVAYILGVPLADDVERQWPQLGEVVRTAELVARVEGNFPELTLADGRAVRVTDYWGEPTSTPEWREPLTARLEMPADGIWPGRDHLGHH